uniref:Uncharacterized protein n=1 Tax=Oryza meridionalis TaxID=40149 RepID=A0A0E0C638_9ORYZ
MAAINRNTIVYATAGAARRHGALLRPPSSLRFHVHPLELEKTNLLLPGTLYPLLPRIVLCSRKMAKKKNPIAEQQRQHGEGIEGEGEEGKG